MGSIIFIINRDQCQWVKYTSLELSAQPGNLLDQQHKTRVFEEASQQGEAKRKWNKTDLKNLIKNLNFPAQFKCGWKEDSQRRGRERAVVTAHLAIRCSQMGDNKRMETSFAPHHRCGSGVLRCWRSPQGTKEQEESMLCNLRSFCR